MNSLEKEIRQLTRLWVQKGGKRNRRQQQRRMLAFAAHASILGANCLAEVGKRHLVAYWRSRENLSRPTLYNHWRALCCLWRLANMRGAPIKPHALTKSEPSTPSAVRPPRSLGP
jgi:hypothetical protein